MVSTGFNNHDNMPWETAVAGISFSCSSGNKILIWKIESLYVSRIDMLTNPIAQGSFYELQDAYDEGFLTKEDIESIAYYHETEKWILYQNFISN